MGGSFLGWVTVVCGVFCWCCLFVFGESEFLVIMFLLVNFDLVLSYGFLFQVCFFIIV